MPIIDVVKRAAGKCPCVKKVKKILQDRKDAKK